MRAPLIAVLGVAMAALTACAPVQNPAVSPPSGVAGSPAAAGTELVLKMQDHLGFSHPGAPLPIPLTVLRDGTLIHGFYDTTSAGEQPAVPTMVRRELTPAGLRTLLDATREAGLTTIADFGDAGVMDAGPTRFTVVIDGRVHSILVEGADFGPLMIEDPLKPVRERLMALRKNLKNLDSWLGGDISAAQPYGYDRMALLNRPLGSAEQPFETPREWPLAGLADARCVVVTGDELAQAARLAETAGAYAAWKSDSKLYYLQFRPMTPDEKDCRSLPSR